MQLAQEPARGVHRKCESCRVREARQRRDSLDTPHLWNRKKNDTNELTEQKETHRLREWTYGCQGKVQLENLGWSCHSAIYKMDLQQGPPVPHRELCSMLCGSLDGMGAWGRVGTHICMGESLACPAETIIALSIHYTPIQNEKFKKEMSIEFQCLS